MNRKLILSILCAALLMPSLAQTSVTTIVETQEYSVDKVRANHFWDNWFVSAGAGAQVYFGDHDKQCKFGDRLAPALDIAVGKWFTPGIGVRLMYSGLKSKGATQKGALSHSTGVDVPNKGYDQYWLEKQKFDMGNFHADVLLNVSNFFWGYNENRLWDCSPYLGIGWGRVWDSPSSNKVTANIGVLNTFRLNNTLDLNLDVRSMLVGDSFDGETGGRSKDGMLSATVGLTYKFKQRGWNRNK